MGEPVTAERVASMAMAVVPPPTQVTDIQPIDPLTGRPIPPEKRCKARNKNCRECKYRYPRGSTDIRCPVCGEERHCRNQVVRGYAVCRMHGARGGAPLKSKFLVVEHLLEKYNRLLGSPNLLSLASELALVCARTEQLMAYLENPDLVAANAKLRDAASKIERGIIIGKSSMVHEGLFDLRAALDPINAEEWTWHKLQENIELARRLTDSERRWLAQAEQTVPVQQVLEFAVMMQRITLKYIKDPVDRMEYGREVHALATGHAA